MGTKGLEGVHFVVDDLLLTFSHDRRCIQSSLGGWGGGITFISDRPISHKSYKPENNVLSTLLYLHCPWSLKRHVAIQFRHPECVGLLHTTSLRGATTPPRPTFLFPLLTVYQGSINNPRTSPLLSAHHSGHASAVGPPHHRFTFPPSLAYPNRATDNIANLTHDTLQGTRPPVTVLQKRPTLLQPPPATNPLTTRPPQSAIIQNAPHNAQHALTRPPRPKPTTAATAHTNTPKNQQPHPSDRPHKCQSEKLLTPALQRKISITNNRQRSPERRRIVQQGPHSRVDPILTHRPTAPLSSG